MRPKICLRLNALINKATNKFPMEQQFVMKSFAEEGLLCIQYTEYTGIS